MSKWKITAKYTARMFLYPIYQGDDPEKGAGGNFQALRDAVRAVNKLNGGKLDGHNEGLKRQTGVA